jgi:hypothetical protein
MATPVRRQYIIRFVFVQFCKNISTSRSVEFEVGACDNCNNLQSF